MWRASGTGPRFIKRGRIFYYKEDLDAWLNENGRHRSTAQTLPPAGGKGMNKVYPPIKSSGRMGRKPPPKFAHFISINYKAIPPTA